jgi:transcriptional regulator with XRE-family HTH domain
LKNGSYRDVPKDAAERMGCSQQYVSKILKGRENLSLETLAKIEDALNLRLVYEPEMV